MIKSKNIPKQPTFPALKDHLRQFSISSWKKWGCIQAEQRKAGAILGGSMEAQLELYEEEFAENAVFKELGELNRKLTPRCTIAEGSAA